MKKRDILLSFSLTLIIIASALFFCSFAPSEQTGSFIRLPAASHIRKLEDKDKAAHIENWGKDDRIWSLRSDASDDVYNPAIIIAAQFALDAPILAVEREFLQAERPRLAPLLLQDGASAPRLFAAQPYANGDMLDIYGHPLRWRIPDNLLTGYSLLRPVAPEPPAAAPRAPIIPKIRYAQGASHYREIVKSFARRYNLNVDLVMAIIHSESDFKPHLVSSKSAMGLMQLLPSTASDEVHRFLYGRRGRVSYAELSVPETNIRYGTAYLHILINRYFANIKNSEMRESCVVAAYNMGPNRFIRLYGRTPELAAQAINAMTPEEFHADLQNRLPARETRYYVAKVRKMKRYYAALGE